MTRIIVGAAIILIGLSAFLGFSLFRFFVAAVLIFVGVNIILGKHRKWEAMSESSIKEDKISEVAVFSAVNRKVESDNFKGGDLTLIFSGGEIDLSEVRTDKREINLEIVAIFGGAKIIIPRGWRVSNKGTAILGGYDIKTGTPADEEKGETTLNLKGTAIFGGVEVVNK